jgi:cobalt-zinc-cadmium efflux system outer membrane protein
MYALNFIKAGLCVLLLTISSGSFGVPPEGPDFIEEDYSPQANSAFAPIVPHHDPIVVDTELRLAEVVELTLEKFPDTVWLAALEEESKAILERSKSWTAGASRAGLAYQEASSGTLHYIDAAVLVPLWNFGQRDAERHLADQAHSSTEAQAAATKLRIAGLIRIALWDMELQSVRHEQALSEVKTHDQLLAKIQRRVELGDLPRTDLLLARTELLQKRSVLTLAEAELMHARKRYSSITQLIKVPAEFQEKLAELAEVQKNHPALAALNSQIERKKAEIDAIKMIGSGQTDLSVGINSDRPSDNDPRSNNTESFNIGVSIPFGGSAHLQPQIAAANVEAARLLAEYRQLYRDLEQAHHEAEHNLEVNKAELVNANELKQVAEEHLKMMQIGFSLGEIDLMDLLRVQSRTQQAVLNAKERSVMLQRDIALYNQAVGVLP